MLEFLTFELNDTRIALPVEAVSSIYEAVAIHPSKIERPGILGDFNLHGEMIPVLNLDRHFKRDIKTTNLDSQIIVLNHSQNLIAIIADDVKGTIRVEPDAVMSLNAVLPQGYEQNPHALTVYDNEIYFVLDLENLLSTLMDEFNHA